MRKFYITCGKVQRIVLGYTDVHACIKSFPWFVEQGKGFIGTIFRVSERGFDKHDDDTIYDTGVLMQIVMLAHAEESEE